MKSKFFCLFAAAAQAKIREAGLPERLAERLAVGQ